MANAIKYSTTGDTQSLKKGNFYFGVGDVGKGPSSATTYYNGVTPVASGYTVYSYDANQTSKINFASPTTDSEFIKITNDKSGQNFTGVTQCLNWYSTQTNHVSVNKDYEGMVTNGLVLNLDASYTPSYTSSGTTWYDLSYDNNNGTLTNGPTFNSGSGGSIVFDGVDDSVDCGVVPSTIYQTFTVSSWVRCTNVGLNNNIVSKNGPYFMRIVSSKLRFNVLTNTGWLFQVGNVTLSNNVWYNLSMVYDGSTWKGYINSNLDFSVSKTGSITTNSTLYIGYTPAAGEQAGFNGNISQTSIYNRSLTTQEILQNYQVMLSRFTGDNIVMDGLVLYLDAGYNGSYIGSGTTWNDISGYGNNGTLTNGVTYSSLNGGVMIFDGVDDYVPVPSLSNSSFPQNSGTISIWYNIDSTGANNNQPLFDNYAGNRDHIFIRRDGVYGTIQVAFQYTLLPTSYVYVSSHTISFNTWHNIVITYVTGFNGYAKVYIDGFLSNSNTISYSEWKPSGQSVGFGYLGQSAKGKGSIIQIYDRPIIGSEILQNYQVMLSRFTGDNIVMNGIVLYLDAGYNGSYIGSGTTWNDISGYGNNGTLVNGVTYSTDYSGSMVFDGADDYVNLGTTLGNFGTSNFTISFFFKTTESNAPSTFIAKSVGNSPTTNYGWLINNGTSGSNLGFAIATTSNNWGSTGTYSIQTSGANIKNGTWQMATIVGDRSQPNISIYLNGILQTLQAYVGSSNFSTVGNVTNNQILSIGSESDISSSPLNIESSISQVQIYNRALSSSEIQQNYNATKSRYVLYKNAYEIKQANPNSPSGIYTISNTGINGGAPTQIYADMETDGGGWTLIMTNSSYLGWTYENSISRNITSPSVATNYSIIGYADALKRSSSGFQYMIDANTRGSWGGIWTANGSYSFTSPLNTNTNITLNTKFGTWIYEDSGIEERMPWYSNKATGAAFITTNGIGSGSWWGTLITDASNWGTAPWIANGMSNPKFIWYWVR